MITPFIYFLKLFDVVQYSFFLVFFYLITCLLLSNILLFFFFISFCFSSLHLFSSFFSPSPTFHFFLFQLISSLYLFSLSLFQYDWRARLLFSYMEAWIFFSQELARLKDSMCWPLILIIPC